MVSLVPQQSVNAAKFAQRLKHKRKVWGAIKFAKERKERLAPTKEKDLEARQYVIQKLNWRQQNIGAPRREALRNAREDWERGPLRPNRAVGVDANLYGMVDRAALSRPNIPEHLFGANERDLRRMKEKIPENVLHKKYPIVEGDRVVIIKGRDANKIGTVRTVMKENNTLIIKGLNKAWVDKSLLDRKQKQEKHEFEIPIPYEDVRLLIPHDVYHVIGGRTVKSREDVIVEAVHMERHTKGTDPFTGKYSYNIPKEHQVDPVTEEVIWHRYVAGTRQPIEWPWEESRQKKLDDARRPGADNKIDNNKTLESSEKKTGVKDMLKKANPLTWFGKEDQKTKDVSSTNVAEDDTTPEFYNPETQHRSKPRDREPADYEDDTPRNIVESNEFIPTLVYPPMPETIALELGQIQAEAAQEEVDKQAEAERRAERKRIAEERKLAKQKQIEERIASMKTPLQIRWELAQAQKQAPQEPSEDLLLALGKHMAEKGVKVKKAKVEELAA